MTDEEIKVFVSPNGKNNVLSNKTRQAFRTQGRKIYLKAKSIYLTFRIQTGCAK